jgi:signal transduction histidine kinase
MMRVFRLSFVARLALILIFSLIAIQMLIVMGYFIRRDSNTGAGFRAPLPDQVAAMVGLMERAPAGMHGEILRAVNSAQLQVRLERAPPGPPAESWRSSAMVERLLKSYLKALEDRKVTVLVQTDEPGLLSRLLPLQSPSTATVIVALKTGDNLVIEAGGPLLVNIFGFPPGFWAGVGGFCVALLAILIIRREAKPLKRLARAADSLDLNEPRPVADFPASAPEIRAVIAAFNRMQERIASLVKSRIVMIGGFSHDVRTYATRLRLRAELIPEEAERARAIRDIDDMIRLLDNALFAIQDRPATENEELLDIAALLQDEVDDKRRIGARAAFASLGEGTPPPVLGNSLALRRLFANLIENAIAYGGEARIFLGWSAETLTVQIEDSGPGIPPDLRESVTQPFVRIERSRSRKTGGAGLGLAIAKKAAESHGGSLIIGEAREGGARITVKLPVFDADKSETGPSAGNDTD